MSISPAGIRKTSPVPIAFDTDKALCAIKLPLEDASNIPMWLIVPQEPVAAVNSIAPDVVAALPDTVNVAALRV